MNESHLSYILYCPFAAVGRAKGFWRKLYALSFVDDVFEKLMAIFTLGWVSHSERRDPKSVKCIGPAPQTQGSISPDVLSRDWIVPPLPATSQQTQDVWLACPKNIGRSMTG